MSVPDVRERIDRAINFEKQHKIYFNFLKENPIKLHQSIQIVSPDKSKKLVKFATTYVRHAPDLMVTVRRKACLLEVEPYVEPFFVLAEAFFLSPIEKKENELIMVVSSAYLAHRLFEEVNDVIYSLTGLSILEKDITQANLVVHTLLGENYVNRLDKMIDQIMKEMTGVDSPFNTVEFKEFLDNQNRVEKNLA